MLMECQNLFCRSLYSLLYYNIQNKILLIFSSARTEIRSPSYYHFNTETVRFRVINHVLASNVFILFDTFRGRLVGYELNTICCCLYNYYLCWYIIRTYMTTNTICHRVTLDNIS